VHAKLDRVELGHNADKLGQSGLGIRHQVLLGHTADQAGRRFLGGAIGARNPAAVHAAAVYVVPEPQRYPHTAVEGHPNQAIEGIQISLLLLRGDADHAHVGELLDIEEARVCRGEKSAVLVAEDHHEAIEAVPSQRIEVARPVRLVVEPAFPIRPVHGVDGDCPLSPATTSKLPFACSTELAASQGTPLAFSAALTLRAPCDAAGPGPWSVITETRGCLSAQPGPTAARTNRNSDRSHRENVMIESRFVSAVPYSSL
jgi:hypothetical protein